MEFEESYVFEKELEEVRTEGLPDESVTRVP